MVKPKRQYKREPRYRICITDHDAEYTRRLEPLMAEALRVPACRRCGAEVLARRPLRDHDRAAVVIHCLTCGAERYVHETEHHPA